MDLTRWWTPVVQRIGTLCLAISFACLPTPSLRADDAEIKRLARAAAANDDSIALPARRKLRDDFGLQGFRALLELRSAGDLEFLKGTDDALDFVGAARYSCRSGLYWHTDLTEALKEAKRTNRPVLSLRMLGKLTDEYSCANSRFFRTTLYVAPNIAKSMQDRFVLHWKTVRPVPILTIDYGDGRVLKRTITGNSAHYVVAADGQPLDVLPGLHAPVAFQEWLEKMSQLHAKYESTSVAARPSLLRQHHAQAEARLNDKLAMFRSGANVVGSRRAARSDPDSQPNTEAPDAARATRIAAPKSKSELPLVANVSGRRLPLSPPRPLKPNRAVDRRNSEPLPTQASSGNRPPRSQEFSDAQKATEIAQPKMAAQAPLVSNVRGDSARRLPLPMPNPRANSNSSANRDPNSLSDETLRRALIEALRTLERYSAQGHRRSAQGHRRSAQGPRRAAQGQSEVKKEASSVQPQRIQRFSNGDEATRIAAPKRLIQAPLVNHVRQGNTTQSENLPPARQVPQVTRPARIPKATGRPVFAPPITELEILKMADSSPELQRLDEETLKLIAEENPTATHRADGDARHRFKQGMIEKLTQGVARDTIRNEFDFHRRAHQWMARGEIKNVEELDRRVYDELFLMPFEDEWLGLVPPSAYTGLRNNGLIRDRNPIRDPADEDRQSNREGF